VRKMLYYKEILIKEHGIGMIAFSNSTNSLLRSICEGQRYDFHEKIFKVGKIF
jgi:hypothetical protein